MTKNKDETPSAVVEVNRDDMMKALKQARWIDGMKDGALATDENLLKVIMDTFKPVP